MKTKILLFVDEKQSALFLKRDLEKMGLSVSSPTKQDVMQAVFEDMPHLILIDEEYGGGIGKRIALQFKEDIVLQSIPIVLMVVGTETVFSKDQVRIDAIIKKGKNLKAIAKLVHETHSFHSHELDVNPLTHLPGIHTAVVKIEREVSSKNEFAVLYVDLTCLAIFNNSYGDVRGDEVIIRMSEILKKALRLYGNAKDFLGHLGGDDFIILTTMDRAVQLSEVIVQTFDSEVHGFYDHEDRDRGYIVQRSPEGNLTQYPIMSVLVAIVENGTTKLKTMADVSRVAGNLARSMKPLSGSCYARLKPVVTGKKNKKRNQYEVHFPGKIMSVMTTGGGVHETEKSARYFYAILKEKKIKTLYQPLIDLQAQRVIGYEALTRPAVHYPTDEATTLFSVARKVNHVKDLDLICIEYALKNAQTLLPDLKLFLNLNHETLVDRRAMENLFLNKGSIGFKNIVIEVTEQSILRSFDKIREALSDLKEQGVSVAIDDVGGGAVSLRDVAMLKPDYIKFDRLLVRQVDVSTTKQQILLSLILFAKGIGSATVAEGVETREEYEAVRMCGVNMVQGYYFARPAEGFFKPKNLSI